MFNTAISCFTIVNFHRKGLVKAGTCGTIQKAAYFTTRILSIEESINQFGDLKKKKLSFKIYHPRNQAVKNSWDFTCQGQDLKFTRPCQNYLRYLHALFFKSFRQFLQCYKYIKVYIIFFSVNRYIKLYNKLYMKLYTLL